MWSRVAACVLLSASWVQAGLLGTGTGEGGCPAGAECCTEYGYCRPQAEWLAGAFRDCNGVSNGLALPPEALAAEAAAAAAGDLAGQSLLVVPAGGAAAAPLSVLPAQPVAAYAPAPAPVLAGYSYPAPQS